jgi:tRNA (cmo5U34)-methyltransferase
MILSTPFTDPAIVGRYTETAPRSVPGFADLQRMALILLSEHATEGTEIVVLGAGGGLEVKAFAEARPEWSFVGIDPSRPMLDLAATVLGPIGSQVRWVHGYAADAPLGPFAGATCLFTFHFLSRAERQRVLRELRKRLKPGAPLVVAHHCAVRTGETERWLSRSVAFAAGAQADCAQAAANASVMARALHLLSPSEEEDLLREAGFDDPVLFYAGFSFRGWVALAGGASTP